MPTGSRPRSSGPSDPGPGPTRDRLRLGGFLLAGLVAASVAVFFLDVVAREMSLGPDLLVAAAEARNLEPGAAVWVAGVPAGRVTRIRFRPAAAAADRRILIRAEIRADAADLLRSDAEASVQVSALLAPSVLAVRPGRAATPLDPSDTLQAVPRAQVSEVMDRASSLAGRLETLRPLARRLARRLEDGPGTLAALRADPATAERLGTGLRAARDLARGADEGSAALLAGDSTLVPRWRRIGRRSGRISAAVGDAAAVTRELDRLAARLSGIVDRVNSTRGTLGRFLGDDALGRERRLLEARYDSVRSELLADPLIWLRFRLF